MFVSSKSLCSLPRILATGSSLKLIDSDQEGNNKIKVERVKVPKVASLSYCKILIGKQNMPLR